jgi:hypothetical protein
MAMVYTVTVSNRTDIRQGYRVACIGLPDDDWNSLGHRVHESKHSNETAARKTAARVAKEYNAKVLG